jgi:hypothetical protein
MNKTILSDTNGGFMKRFFKKTGAMTLAVAMTFLGSGFIFTPNVNLRFMQALRACSS